jgi:hypothetical protein
MKPLPRLHTQGPSKDSPTNAHKWKKKRHSTVKNKHMAYFILGGFELHVNKAPHNTIASLVVTINEVMGNLDKDTVAKACRCFQIRIEAVVEENLRFF